MAGASNGDIYKLINDLRLESKGDIQRLENAVTTSLRQLENVVNDMAKDVNKMKVKEATLSTKIYMLVGSISIVASAMVDIIGRKFLQ